MPFVRSSLRHVLLRQNQFLPFVRSPLTPHLRSYAAKKKIPRGAPLPTPKPVQAKKPTIASPKKPAVGQQAQPTVSTVAQPTYGSLAQQLAKAGRPTLLYANHPTLFISGCYGFCGLGIAWILYTYKTNLEDPPQGLPAWVQKAQWLGIGLMGIVVGIFWIYPPRLVQKIIAIPVAAVGNRPATVKIELHRRPWVPLLPLKKITINNVESITLDRPMHELLHKAEVLESLPDNRSYAKRALSTVWSSPYRLFSAVKGVITSQNFISVRITDFGTFMIHKDGWIWERRGLDRLFGTNRFSAM